MQIKHMEIEYSNTDELSSNLAKKIRARLKNDAINYD